MKKASDIHSLDSLDKEIYRLQLQAKNTEEQLDKRIGRLRTDFPSLLANTLFCRKQKATTVNGKEGMFGSAFDSNRWQRFFNKITDRVADRAASGLENLVERIFHKKKEK